MKPPIAILFANLKGNLGDFAILHAMLLDLNRKFPGQPLHVFSHGFHTVDQKRLAAFKASSDVEFDFAGTTDFYKIEPKLLASVIRFVGLWPVAQAYLVKSLTERVASRSSQFRDYDAIVIAGGDQGGGAKARVSIFATLSAVHRYNDQIYAFPFSVNPQIRQNNSKAALQQHFRRIRQPLIVRDGITKTVMDGLDINCVLGVDSVFALHDLADDIEPMAQRDRSRVLFALTSTSSGFERDLRSALRRIGPIGGGIALLTTCELEDGKHCEALAREFAIPYYAPATWQETVAEMKASSLVVTNRLHGLILGSLARTPLLPVADRKKSEAFVKDAQIPHSAPGIHALTGELLERCVSGRDAILQRMNHYRDQARSAACSPLADASRSPERDARLGEPAAHLDAVVPDGDGVRRG